MNTGESWPDRDTAEVRVLVMQMKLHQWAKADPGRRFDDVFNLVYDPSFLVVAWNRVRGNKGARTAGIDGVAPRSIVFGAEKLLTVLRRIRLSRMAYPTPHLERPKRQESDLHLPVAQGPQRRGRQGENADRPDAAPTTR